jgi:hypothetical protein
MLSSCHSPTCKCYCHTQGFAGDISQHVCDLQPPAESEPEFEFIEVTPGLQKKMDDVVDKWDKSQTSEIERYCDHGQKQKDCPYCHIRILESKLRLALDALDYNPRFGDNGEFDPWDYIANAKRTNSQIQLLTPQHEAL